MYQVNIQRISNGFILEEDWGNKEAFHTLDELFNRLLLHYEGRADTFNGESFGKVTIERGVSTNTVKG